MAAEILRMRGRGQPDDRASMRPRRMAAEIGAAVSKPARNAALLQ